MTEAVEKNIEKKMVTLTIDDIEVTVPEGTNLVDAAKMAGIDIPVFCYHPKMDPVGMCRMCLVDIGMPLRDRTTGELVLDDEGKPQIQFGRTLVTGCTERVAEGMVVVGYSEKVQKARADVIEFLLTSHPLDCPVCDKGGECPLQNLSMANSAGESRFYYSDKSHADKVVPLGDLIFLDRERCIHCSRCIRFQEDVAGDAVLGFDKRGRATEIVTFSEPGFDSYWSGNTTDICPVGALTTADFRFGARPWEMQASASICNHCPVGCNLTFNTRREAKSGGEFVIKRAMPRQNEQVNEIWVCDKGRFGYQFASHEDRITRPMVRKGDKLVATTWGKAFDLVAEKIKETGDGLVTLAGGRLSNEDYFNIGALTEHLGGKAVLYSSMAGGEQVARVGVGEGTNFSDMGAGDVIFVIACDLEEEAPLYWLRVNQAARRGATVIVANPRRTKTDRRAAHTLRYDYGEEAALVLAMLNALSPKQPKLPETVKKLAKDKAVKEAAKVFAEADNAIVLYGSEGMGLADSQVLAQACENLLIATGHVGKANNGLIAVWDKGNDQGAWDMGLRPRENLAADLAKAKVAYIVGADPAGDDPALAKAMRKASFVVVQEIHKTATTEMADLVLPAAAFTEREGTYTNAERRVQRLYPAVPSSKDLYPDYAVTAEIAARVGLELEKDAAALVFLGIVGRFADYADLDYRALAEVSEQWPQLGSEDYFYGGTAYNNHQGLGVQLRTAAERGEPLPLGFLEPPMREKADGLVALPITTLYDQGSTLRFSAVLQTRLAQPYVILHPEDADGLGITPSGKVSVKLNGTTNVATAVIDNSLPKSVVLVPRSLGMPISGPTPVAVKAK
jgi:NADH-quinone oxidoreductase subunit G